MNIDERKIKQLATSEAKTAAPDNKRNSTTKLLSDNALDYKMEQELSLVSSRSSRRMYSEKTEYGPNESVIVDLQTGSLFVNPENSYLTFKLAITSTEGGTQALGFGHGSACNFIRDVIITSRSGTEIERVRGLNILRYTLDKYDEDNDFINHRGTLMGYGETVACDGSETTFIIPMSKIAGLFAQKGKLLPSFLCSGLRIELVLETAAMALTTTKTNVDYTIKKPTFMLDCMKLTDATESVLMNVSSANGLEYTFTTWDRSTFQTSALQNFLEVRKAVSHALRAIGITRTTDQFALTEDSIEPEDFKVVKSQWRLGSQYFPVNPLTDEKEHYWNALHVFDEVSKGNDVYVSYDTFLDGNGDAVGKTGITGVLLERSNVLAHQSLPINSSRTLGYDVDFLDEAPLPIPSRQIDVFLEYKAVARIFLNNLLVKS
jgi:hypothetical protein